jgi:hypothetical protein
LKITGATKRSVAPSQGVRAQRREICTTPRRSVDALAADTGGKGALGLDVPTATAFVLAGLDLAAGALVGNPPNPAVGAFQSFSFRTMHPRF